MYVGFDLTIASFDSISEVSMVRLSGEMDIMDRILNGPATGYPALLLDRISGKHTEFNFRPYTMNRTRYGISGLVVRLDIRPGHLV